MTELDVLFSLLLQNMRNKMLVSPAHRKQSVGSSVFSRRNNKPSRLNVRLRVAAVPHAHQMVYLLRLTPDPL